MINDGPNTNNSKFYITLQEWRFLNQKNVIFGRVIYGFEHIKFIE